MRIDTLVAVAAVALSLSNPVQAGFVIGTQAITVPGDKFLDNSGTPNAGDINNATIFTFATPIFAGESRTGDFQALYGQQLVSISNGTTLNLGNVSAFTFGDSSFGTFTTSALLEDANGSQFSRSITLSGVFTPGADFPTGQRDSTPATFNLVLSQTQGNNGAIGVAATLDTFAPQAVSAVPAPASAVLLLTALPFLGFCRRLRRAI